MHARKNQVRSGSKYVILLACSENGTLCVIMLLKLLLSLVPLCLSTLPGVGRVIGETKANLRTFMSLFLSLVIRCEPVSGGVLWHIAEAICQHIWSRYWNFSWLTGDFWAAIARKYAWLQLCAHVCNLLSMSCFYSKLVKCQSEAVSSSFRLIFQPDRAWLHKYP